MWSSVGVPSNRLKRVWEGWLPLAPGAEATKWHPDSTFSGTQTTVSLLHVLSPFLLVPSHLEGSHHAQKVLQNTCSHPYHHGNFCGSFNFYALV